MAHGLSCSAACGIFPDQGSNPCPPALAGGFLTTGPPGKSKYQSILITPKRNPIPISSHFPLPPSLHLWQPQIYFVSLWICLYWTFHINGIIHYVVFCVWLLSLSIMFSGFIHVVIYIITSFLFMAE